MRNVYFTLRSAFFWTLSVLHFFPVATLLVALGAIVDPRRNDRPQRVFFRNVIRLAGARFRVERAPGFDPDRTSFFVCNHVNVFDPMIIYSAIPQFVRGLELESHFRVPVYGWMMKRFGNIPVPARGNSAALVEMKERCRAALEGGISLIVFPEGTRTRTGRLGELRPGVFRMAREFGYPIVPMSIVGAFEFKKKGDWMLRPSTIVVHLHDTIDVSDVRAGEEKDLRERVRRVMAAPIDNSYASAG